MFWFFFDTSAIVKRYHQESGSEIVDRIFEGILKKQSKAILSTLAVLEFTSALRRKVTTGEVTWKQLRDSIGTFLKEVYENFRIERVDEGMFADSLELILKYGLSTLDSLQLVSSIRVSEAFTDKSKIIFTSADEELCKAAEKEGFKVINPETEKLEKLKLLEGEF